MVCPPNHLFRYVPFVAWPTLFTLYAVGEYSVRTAMVTSILLITGDRDHDVTQFMLYRGNPTDLWVEVSGVNFFG